MQFWWWVQLVLVQYLRLRSLRRAASGASLRMSETPRHPFVILFDVVHANAVLNHFATDSLRNGLGVASPQRHECGTGGEETSPKAEA